MYRKALTSDSLSTTTFSSIRNFPSPPLPLPPHFTVALVDPLQFRFRFRSEEVLEEKQIKPNGLHAPPRSIFSDKGRNAKITAFTLQTQTRKPKSAEVPRACGAPVSLLLGTCGAESQLSDAIEIPF